MDESIRHAYNNQFAEDVIKINHVHFFLFSLSMNKKKNLINIFIFETRVYIIMKRRRRCFSEGMMCIINNSMIRFVERKKNEETR